MSYDTDTQVLTYNVFVSNALLQEQENNPELAKGYEMNFVKQAVDNLSRTLIESDMIEAHKEYNYKRGGYMHTFSVRVEPPR